MPGNAQHRGGARIPVQTQTGYLQASGLVLPHVEGTSRDGAWTPRIVGATLWNMVDAGKEKRWSTAGRMQVPQELNLPSEPDDTSSSPTRVLSLMCVSAMAPGIRHVLKLSVHVLNDRRGH